MNAYYTVDEVEAACHNLCEAYPRLAELIALPDLTAEGRLTHAMRLHRGDGNPRPVFLIVGGLHGGEWGSSEIALNLAAELLGALSGAFDLQHGPLTIDADQVQAMFTAIDVVVFPLVNPDGRHHSQQASVNWRKNRSLAMADPEQPETIGVDLNRNFNFLFDLAKGFSPHALVATASQPQHETYQGPGHQSEPETRNVVWLVQRFAQVRCFVDLHSGAQGVIYPWGDDQMQAVDPQQNFANPAHDGLRGVRNAGYAEYMPAGDQLAHARLADVFIAAASAVNNRVYGHLPGFDFMASSGTSHDWVCSRHFGPLGGQAKTLCFAIEWCSDTPRPDFPLMADIVTEVSAGLLAMALDVSVGAT